LNAPDAMHAAADFSAPRVVPNAARAFGGIWRLTSRRFFRPTHWLVLGGMFVLLVLFSLPVTPTRESAAGGYLPWASRFYVCFLVPILAFISAAGLMRDDLKSESVDYILTRPVRRPLFVFFRYVSQVACAQLEFLGALAVVTAVGLYHHVPNIWTAVPLLWAGQALAIVAFSAFGFLCALLTSRYVIVGLAYGAIVEVGIGNVPTQLNQLSIIRHVLTVMRSISAESVMGISGPASASLSTATSVGAILGFSVVMLGAAAVLFAFKELAGGGREA
jgi:ABC-2 type transport system permease protein